LFWQPKFRLLEGWNIDFDDGIYTGQSAHGVKKKLGTIYDWGSGRMPKDYIFHEILHFAMAVVREAKPYLKRREAEEILVQDLSQIMLALPLDL